MILCTKYIGGSTSLKLILAGFLVCNKNTAVRQLILKYKKIITFSYVILNILFFHAPAFADTTWELGVGVANVTSNAYPGSDERLVLTAPVPYFKVKTDWLDLDREGIHTHWFDRSRFSLDFNFDFGLPVDSDKNNLRFGMPDLKAVGQIGPMLSYRLNNSANLKWQIQVPLMYSYSFDKFKATEVGWFVNPRIYFKYNLQFKERPLYLNMSLGPVYGSQSYHQYYYDVESSYVTSEREEYSAKEGFSGYRANLVLTRRMSNYWIGLYLRYQNITDAVYVESPLVKKNDYWFVGVAISWIFAGNM